MNEQHTEMIDMAVRLNCKRIIQWELDTNSNSNRDLVNEILLAACTYAQPEIFDMIDEYFDSYMGHEDGEWYLALNEAAQSGCAYIISRILEISDSPYDPVDYDELMHLACEYGHNHLIELVAENWDDPNWNMALFGACSGGHKSLVMQLLTTKDWAWDLQLAINIARDKGHDEIADYMERFSTERSETF